MNTITQYNTVVAACESVFLKKAQDYGTSWRMFRPISIVDQIYIKAWRIRQIQENKGVQQIEDSIASEFSGIINYGYIALIQAGLGDNDPLELDIAIVQEQYKAQVDFVRALMLKKNHDYGEAWRNMSQESFADLILTKLLRIKQILANDGKTIISEGMEANFCDIINYAIFALILIDEQK
ncbi:hypothetical protein DBR32_09260 [Taibaiella sp. KBW10]|uniref:DUF1599 domain-containing protein n=1 Tax=Taibaiella sp. KBW10 TaxID=2153357 RepID=UPI000F5B6E4C|nr:DUF1599 domain-containing protein [Taibaiella sp. KBW10]RQO30891.1 hypothetical protein DBR32_09260 [Taibaiella sp. KBW10]